MEISNNNPLVSVIIPTFNREGYIEEALDSIFAQTYQNYEVIVVDDGSTDRTLEILRRYGERITVFSQTNQGSGAARNLGVTNAAGSYIAFLDSDDVWYADKLEAQVQVAKQYPSAGIIISGCSYINDEGSDILSDNFPPSSISYRDLAVVCVMPGGTSNALILRSAFDGAGGFDTRMRRGQDHDLWMRLSSKYEIRTLRKVTVKIRLHNEARHMGSIAIRKECRELRISKVSDEKLRRRAMAWSHVSLFKEYWSIGEYATASKHLAKSYLFSAFHIHRRVNRARIIVQSIRSLMFGRKGGQGEW